MVSMNLTILGSSAGTPSRLRNVTSMALALDDGQTWIFDCGEATQHQILKTSVKPARISRIFITHFHGDHWYGLLGLLAAIKNHGRIEPVEIISQPGLKEVVNAAHTLSYAKFPFELRFTEMEGFGTLTFREGLTVSAIPIKHSVPSLAYLIEELDKPGTFDIAKARQLGLDTPQYLQVLSRGGTVSVNGQSYDGAEFRGERKPGLKIVILGDTCDASAVANYVSQCDWLTHECTYDEDMSEKALQFGHSTSVMAARTAELLSARNLILTHFSPRYEKEGGKGIADLKAEVTSRLPTTKVHVAEDLITFDLRD